MKNIFNMLKKETAVQVEANSFMPSTRSLRETITGFITQSLQPYIDEKSRVIAGLHFYMLCENYQEEEAVRLALFTDRPGMFKTEHLERILANHFIQFDPAWFFEWHIVKDQLPEECMQQGKYGLKVTGTGQVVSGHFSKAGIQLLAGQTEQTEYELDPEKQLKFYIGRSRTPQLSSGKIQKNDIVFLAANEPGYDELTGKANLHVSRNHAYIIYEPATDRYLLYPDKGGLPDNGNKLKVHTVDDKVKWLNIYGVPHCLCDGDQVELGGAAVLRFVNV